MIASCLDAFMKAIGELRTHYDILNDSTQPNVFSTLAPPEYPYPTTVANFQIKYTGRPFPTKLLFTAKVLDQDGDWYVKFTQRYSPEVHEFLAKQDLAPTLLGCRTLVDGWIVVLMAKSTYRPLYDWPLTNNAKSRLKSKLKEVVDILHSAGYVHGDLRNTNILVEVKTINAKDIRMHIVDFDWAGKTGETVYPFGVNCTTVKRAPSVGGGVSILKEHDEFMIDHSTS